MIFVLLITGTLAGLFVFFTRLTGSGDENALFLIQMLNTQINLRGLLLGGMIIGALGVLDDLVTTQASAVFELHHANESLGFRALFQAAMRIGQDHVAATVNTLVLAYAGAALPMLLMFSLGRSNYGFLINFEFIAEEIVRTLVGSLGLVTAVPLTTAIAILFVLRADSLENGDKSSVRRGAEMRIFTRPRVRSQRLCARRAAAVLAGPVVEIMKLQSLGTLTAVGASRNLFCSFAYRKYKERK
jgi:uncharacterized membrane protein